MPFGLKMEGSSALVAPARFPRKNWWQGSTPMSLWARHTHVPSTLKGAFIAGSLGLISVATGTPQVSR